MLKKINLSNFKSHKDTHVDFSNLTVLCGSNGVGKSSIIQILLLLREAYIKERNFNILDLKSNSVKIGTAIDAIYEFGDFDGFRIDLDFNNGQSYKFCYQAFTEIEKTKSFITLNDNESLLINDPNELSLFNKNLQYISAARKGPMEKYDKDDKIVDVYRQISVVEGQAEYFVHFLDKYRNDDSIDELCILNEDNKYKDLYTQVSLWEKYIFNGANAEIQDIGKLGYVLRYSYDNEKSTTKKNK